MMVHFYCFKCFRIILKSKGNARLFSFLVWERKCSQFWKFCLADVKRKYILGYLSLWTLVRVPGFYPSTVLTVLERVYTDTNRGSFDPVFVDAAGAKQSILWVGNWKIVVWVVARLFRRVLVAGASSCLGVGTQSQKWSRLSSEGIPML